MLIPGFLITGEVTPEPEISHALKNLGLFEFAVITKMENAYQTKKLTITI